MSFEFQSGEGLSHAVKRVGRTELRKGREALGEGDIVDSAHVLRVATKKVRALALMVRPSVGRPAREVNRRLGACADVLAALRDADASVRAFEQVRSGLPVRLRPETDGARTALVDRLLRQAEELQDSAVVRKLARKLRRQEKRVGTWAPDGDGWKMVGPGLDAGYRRARQAMHHAYRAPDGESFHAWRRAVKVHRFQVRLVSPWSPGDLTARADELGALALVLGDEHDLTILRRTFRANRSWFGDDGEVYREVLRCIEQQRRAKRTQAQPLGERLFAERPGAFGKRMHQLFRGHRRAISAPVAA